VLRLYSIFQPPEDGLFMLLKFIPYPLPLCFKLLSPSIAETIYQIQTMIPAQSSPATAAIGITGKQTFTWNHF
jgi:hypothetical protein